MNDDRTLERQVTAVYDEAAPTREPQGLLDDVLLTTSHSRQRPGWLALIKEPPMRTQSRLTVGSPTARVMAIVVATMLATVMLVGAGIAGTRLLAADAAIVVAADGSGDHTSISAAIEAASDGDAITVMAGDYPESVVVDKDISISGEPEADVIVGPCSGAACIADEDGEPIGFFVDHTDAELSGLIVRRPESSDLALLVDGGSSRISDNHFDGNVAIVGNTTALLEGNRVEGRVDAYTIGSDGAMPIVRGNEGIWIAIDGAGLVEANELRFPEGEDWIEPDSLDLRSGDGLGGFAGIYVNGGEGWIIRDNVLSGAYEVGIRVPTGSGTVVNNTIDSAITGVEVGRGDNRFVGNTVTNGITGMSISTGSPEIVGNQVLDNEGPGIAITSTATPVLSGNTSCGNSRNLMVLGAAEPVMDGTNEICEDAG